MKKIIIWLLIIGIITATGVYLYLFYFAAKHNDPLKSKEIVTVTATNLFDLYSTNEDSANKLYAVKDIAIKVSGIISSIEMKDQIYTINYVTNGTMGTVICEMDVAENPKLKDMKPGQTISVVGFCNGINLDVYLDRCKLAE